MDVVAVSLSSVRTFPGFPRRKRRAIWTCAVIAILTLFLLLLAAHRTQAESPDGTDAPLANDIGRPDAAPEMMEPLVAINSSPENYVMPFAPHWIRTSQGRTLGFGMGLDKMLSPNSDLEVDSSWEASSPHHGATATGFGSVDVMSRYAVINHPDLQVAIAPRLSVSTTSFGSSFGLGEAGLALLFGGRGGALPEAWKLGYFRALEFHSDLGYSRILSNGSGDEIFFDPVVDYSVPYSRYLTEAQVPWPLGNLCVFAELNFDAVVSGTDHAPPTLYTTPGLAYLTEAYQVSVGVQLPLNHAGAQNQQLAVLGQIQFNLDDAPLFGWMPF
jgi:hypothetical protein